MIYFVCTLLSIICCYGIKRQTKTFEKRNCITFYRNSNYSDIVYLILAAAPFFGVSALRYGIGTDYFFTYVPQFELIVKGEKVYYEKGFWVINKFVSLFTDEPQFLIATVAFLFTAIVFWAFYRVSENIVMSIILMMLSYSFFVSLNNIRQSLASAILIWAFYYIYERKDIRALICVILAGLIHQVSLVFLIFFVLRYIKINSKLMLTGAFIMLALVRFANNQIISVLMRIPRLALYYSEDSEAVAGFLGKSISIAFIFVNLCIFLLFIYVDMISEEHKDEQNNLLLWNQMMIIAVCAVDGIAPAAYRIVRIFSFLQFAYLPNIIERFEFNKRNKAIIYCVLCVLFGFLFLQNYTAGAEEVFPYQSILNN